MRPRKLDHFKGFNFYVVEDVNAPTSSRTEADVDDETAAGGEKSGDGAAGKNGLDRWFEVRREVLPPDEDDERNREDPTWKVRNPDSCPGIGLTCASRPSKWRGSGITRFRNGTSRMRSC